MKMLMVWLAMTALAPARAAIDPKALPLGNGKYSRTPQVGSLYSCGYDAMYTITATGRSPAGWWIHGATWDPSEKPKTAGRVSWAIASVSISVQGDKRVIATNDLPVGEFTGVYPMDVNDPAYPFDHNPNALRAQSISVSVPRDPTVAAQPSCIGLAVAIGLDGAVYFSALDSQGRDEPAYEFQDVCGGMPSPWPDGMYHRYRPNDCMPRVNEPAALLGYALDGFGLYSPYDENGKELTTADLDECHGRTSPVMWDGRLVNMYHYVMTRDFPYTLGCYRGDGPAVIPMSKPPQVPEGLAPPTNAAAPTGAVTAVDCETIKGWTCDADNYKSPLTAFFYADGPREGQQAAAGAYLGVVSADDAGGGGVASSCGGEAAHGFSIPVPAELKDGRTHAVYAYAADVDSAGWAASGTFVSLNASPMSFVCQPTIIDAGLRAREGGVAVPLAAERGTASPLQLRSLGDTYGVPLVEPSDPNASSVILRTPQGPKSLRRL